MGNVLQEHVHPEDPKEMMHLSIAGSKPLT